MIHILTEGLLTKGTIFSREENMLMPHMIHYFRRRKPVVGEQLHQSHELEVLIDQLRLYMLS
jgi:hypothetical protein